jgi:hypothetical protein
VAWAGAVIAQNAATPAPTSTPAPAATAEATPAASTPRPAKRYELKNRSSFDVAENARAPFLPIGWVKPQGSISAPVVQQANIDASGFRLTSILIGNPSLAVINGRSYEEGQFLRLPRGGPQVRIRLYRIGDGQVWLQIDDKLHAVPLKRPELGERKVEEQLLSEEREIVPQVPAPAATPATPQPNNSAATAR